VSAAAPCCGRGAFVARRWASPFAVAAVRCVAPVALPVVPSSALPVSVLGCRARLSPPSPPGGLAVRRCAACGRVKGRETQLDLALRARSHTGPRRWRGLPDSPRPRLPAGPRGDDLRVERVVLLAAIVRHCSAAARSFVLAALRALHLAPASAAPGSAVKEARGNLFGASRSGGRPRTSSLPAARVRMVLDVVLARFLPAFARTSSRHVAREQARPTRGRVANDHVTEAAERMQYWREGLRAERTIR